MVDVGGVPGHRRELNISSCHFIPSSRAASSTWFVVCMTGPLPRSLIQEEYIGDRLGSSNAGGGSHRYQDSSPLSCRWEYIAGKVIRWWLGRAQGCVLRSVRKGAGGADDKRELAQKGRRGESWKPCPELVLFSRAGRKVEKLAIGGCWRTNGSELNINRHGINGKRNLGRPRIEDAARVGIFCVPFVRVQEREPAWRAGGKKQRGGVKLPPARFILMNSTLR